MEAVVTTVDEHDLYPCHEEDHVTQGDPHYWQVHYLGGAIQTHRPDLRVSCDICHYWEPGNVERYVAPDVSVIAGPPPRQRPRVYLAYSDPPVLFVAEIASPSKRESDVKHKRAIYELVLQLPEHLEADPERGLLALWQWGERAYRAVPPDAGGRVWSEQLELWLGYDEDGFLRLYTRDGAMLLTQEEEAQRADAEAERADAEAERADAEVQRADAEARRRAAAEQQAAAEARRRADAERRLAELTAELDRLRRGNGPVA
jgi:hypothetical protein